jgi:hypothetical protein
MKSNLKFDTKNFVAEISISNMMEEDEMEMHSEYMSECMLKDESLINTAGMSTSDAKYMCGMSYMKNRPMLNEMSGQLTEKQKTLPPAIQKAILKRMQKNGNLNEEGKKEAGESPEGEKSEAAQIAVFPQDPAPPTSNIMPHLTEQGIKVDEKLKSEQEASAPKNPDLQSPTFDPKA